MKKSDHHKYLEGIKHEVQDVILDNFQRSDTDLEPIEFTIHQAMEFCLNQPEGTFPKRDDKKFTKDGVLNVLNDLLKKKKLSMIQKNITRKGICNPTNHYKVCAVSIDRQRLSAVDGGCRIGQYYPQQGW